MTNTTATPSAKHRPQQALLNTLAVVQPDGSKHTSSATLFSEETGQNNKSWEEALEAVFDHLGTHETVRKVGRKTFARSLRGQKTSKASGEVSKYTLVQLIVVDGIFGLGAIFVSIITCFINGQIAKHVDPHGTGYTTIAGWVDFVLILVWLGLALWLAMGAHKAHEQVTTTP